MEAPDWCPGRFAVWLPLRSGMGDAVNCIGDAVFTRGPRGGGVEWHLPHFSPGVSSPWPLVELILLFSTPALGAGTRVLGVASHLVLPLPLLLHLLQPAPMLPQHQGSNSAHAAALQ